MDRTLDAVVRGVRIVVSEMRPSGALPKQQLGAATGAGAVAVQVHWKCVRWLHEIVAVQAASGRTRPLAMLGVRPVLLCWQVRVLIDALKLVADLAAHNTMTSDYTLCTQVDAPAFFLNPVEAEKFKRSRETNGNLVWSPVV